MEQGSNIQKKFGSRPLLSFPHSGYFRFYFTQLIGRVKFFHILNYIDYVKEEVADFLEKEFHWKPYEAKHFESVYNTAIGR